MSRGVFVTGTGTEVGKTVVAGIIARTAADDGARVNVFKPAVSGLDEIEAEGTVPDHEHLRLAARSEQTDDEISPYRYGPAVSPHLAAQEAGEAIDPALLRGRARTAADDCDFFVCEGVGGFLVPLRVDYSIRDFARDLGLPVVIVAAPGLGTINHTLLTIEAVRQAGLEVLDVVFSMWPGEPTPMHESNADTIARVGRVSVSTWRDIDVSDPASWGEYRLYGRPGSE